MRMGGVLALLLFVGFPTMVPGPVTGAGGEIAPAPLPDLRDLGTGAEVRPVTPALGEITSGAPIVPSSSPVFSNSTRWIDVLVVFVILYSILLVLPGGSIATWIRMRELARAKRWDRVERRRGADRRHIPSDWDVFERRVHLAGSHGSHGGRRLADRHHLRIA